MQTFLKTFLFLCMTLFCTLVVISCEAQHPEDEWSKELPTTDTYHLSLIKTSIIINSEGSSETFGITSNDNWTISTSESWIKVSDITGAGEKSVTVTVEANTGKAIRIGKIIVKGMNSSIEKTITITQQFNANGHDYVDLGLPSGLLWATCNVGACKPDEYGDYFSWGDTLAKSTYHESTYKYFMWPYYSLAKYNNSSSDGTVDNKTVLDQDDDAAHANWGGNWRMPTTAELDELIDNNNCTWIWTTQNGVHGYKVNSKKNANSIFLPAAGYVDDSSLDDAGSYGCYWSSSLYTGYPYQAYYLNFHSIYVVCNSYSRSGGLSVRPVWSSLE